MIDPDAMTFAIQTIGSVGFPIVACCALFFIYKETIDKITVALNTLTQMVSTLSDTLVTKTDNKED